MSGWTVFIYCLGVGWVYFEVNVVMGASRKETLYFKTC